MLKSNENSIMLLLNLDKKLQVLQDIVLSTGQHTHMELHDEKKEKTVRFQIEESDSVLNLNEISKETASDEDPILRNRKLKSMFESTDLLPNFIFAPQNKKSFQITKKLVFLIVFFFKLRS
jgi:hypothetical protein